MPYLVDKRNRILLAVLITSLIILGVVFFNYFKNTNKTEDQKEEVYNCTIISNGNCKDNNGEYSNYCNGTDAYVSFYCGEKNCVSEIIQCPENYVCENSVCVEIEEETEEEPVIEEESEPKKVIPKHTICNNNNGSCIFVDGDGEDECQTDEDCGCICDTGLCCDGCYYRNTNHICESNFQKDFGCPWGTECGSNVGVRYKIRYCPGDDTDCTGEISDWQNWTVYANCTAYQICIEGAPNCKYYPYCR